MKILKIKQGKKRQSHITKQLVHSFLVNIRISQPSKVMFTVLGLRNPDVNFKRMHQLYNVESKTGMMSSCFLAGIYGVVPW